MIDPDARPAQAQRIQEIAARWEREVDDKLHVYTGDGGTPLERAIFRNQVRMFFIDEFTRLEAALSATEAQRAAMETLVARCRELDACLRDPEANGYDGATTRTMWRLALSEAQTALTQRRGDEHSKPSEAGQPGKPKSGNSLDAERQA